jgi:hypothetical protein
VPELSYWIMLDPQVRGPADAGSTEPTAKASTSARVILDNMAILLVSKPQAASAEEEIGRRRRLFPGRPFEGTLRGARLRVLRAPRASHLSEGSEVLPRPAAQPE